MPSVCSYKRENGAWVAISARGNCNAPSVGAPDGTTIKIDCGSGTLIDVTKGVPQVIGANFPPGATPQDVVELTFEGNEWKSGDGENWTSKINSAAPAGTKIIVSKSLVGNEHIVYSFKGPNA